MSHIMPGTPGDTNPTAREQLFRRVSGAFVNEDRANALLDAYRAEVLAEAEAEIAAAIDRCRSGSPDEPAMVTRRLGMRAAERIVWSLRLDGGESRG